MCFAELLIDRDTILQSEIEVRGRRCRASNASDSVKRIVHLVSLSRLVPVY